MNKTEINKELYKQTPKAHIKFIRMGTAYYYTHIRGYDKKIPYTINVDFAIPISDMGNTDFHADMDAKLLIRWIDIPQINHDRIIL